MKVCDRMCMAEGEVVPSFVDLKTGKKIKFGKRSNKLSYMSAEAMAAAFGGNPLYIPSRVGFIYGDKSSMPSESPITRSQSWNDLKRELEAGRGSATLDVQVVGFSYSPSLGPENPSADSSSSDSELSSSSYGSSSDGDQGDYCNILATGSNAITFHAVSNSSDVGSMFESDAFINGNYVYQAVLLGYDPGNDKYYIISRVSLKDKKSGNYLPKPSGFEIALDWTIVFH